ncbi:putative transposon protein [Symbiodinium microadriaticum]|uniref:Putative transposon protein n=1 Tax=Symbiodinium microadriaticum TaxID=2951 RepID=A0A1Q9CZP3_SYMMI|nr:putative transposon protein [Symbiodinium microadriaticum]
MGDQSHGLRYFNGDDNIDWREYRRWKLWCQNKFLVMDKLPKEARGKEGGEKAIFEILDKRWPERDRTDEIGENITEVFSLRAREGELLRTWCARARECFDRCSRKTGVSFPEEAKGWIVLNYSGMSEEQRAVVLARTGGDLKHDPLTQAMRSCFPEYIVPRKRGAMAAHYLETDEDYQWWGNGYDAGTAEDATTGEGEEAQFHDVELFLAEHGREETSPDSEVFPESEVAEVLAATWKDRRQELNRLQRARKFPQADDLKKSFRVEIEELKRKTQCNRCGRTGHWARECRVKMPASSTSSAAPTSAGMVQHFVCHAVQIPQTMMEQLRSRRDQGPEQELLLVSSPGFAVLDSGCGKSVIGEETLKAFRQLWQDAGVGQPNEKAEVNIFRFGNGAQEVSNRLVEMPVCMAGRRGIVKAAIIGGRAPLLLSRPALKTLGASMDFGRDELSLFNGDQAIPMNVNEAGQYIIPVANFDVPITAEHEGTPPILEDSWVVHPGSPEPTSPAAPDAEAAPEGQWTPHQWRQVQSAAKRARRKVSSSSTEVPSDKVHVVEVFGAPKYALECLTKGLKGVSADLLTGWDLRRAADRDRLLTLIAEQKPELLVLGSPCTWLGGWYDVDPVHSDEHTRREKAMLSKLLLNFAADLANRQLTQGGRVFFCEPATSAAWGLFKWQQLARRMFSVDLGECVRGGGWYDVDPVHSDEHTRREKAMLSKLLLNFAADLANRQLTQGGRVFFCEPATSAAWGLFKWQSRPANCDEGPCVASEHDLAWQAQRIGEIGDLTSSKFVKSVLRTVRELPRFGACVVQVGSDFDCFVAGRVAELNEQRREQMLASLHKLHTNLGHPPNPVLVRVLKHGGASQAALDLARELTCEVCEAQKQPKPAPLAQTHRVTEFNRRVGLDVKYLPGWLPNQKIPALNIVDYASSFQIMVPLPSGETGELLRQALQERWISWAGVPHEIVVDPAQTNLSDALTVPQELAGSVMASTAAEAHWQLGKVEVHGGWFSRVLQKVIAECAPHDRQSWLECVIGAHCKNELIQVYGMTPAQFVFGRNPRVPSNLLDEPLDVIPATASLHEEAVARRVAIRQTARQAMVALQDDKALRLSLAARLPLERHLQGRLLRKTSPEQLHRPSAMLQDDFSELMHEVDEAKAVEWNTVLGRNATRLVLGREAEKVRQKLANRIMGSRYVITVKKEDDAPARIKARWCLQGHLDPDLAKKATAGDLQSPTLSQVGRSVLFQLIASHKWLLRLGDIKGAFLSSGELPATYRPLYARLPPGGIPGVPSDALIEVLGHVYGLNDAPSAWQKTLNKALLEVGFERSRFDPCIYYMRDNGRLVGIYGVHVDDSATGGDGEKYNSALEALRQRFEFRKWRIGDGDFCGAHYKQDPTSHDITMSQEGFVEKLRPLRLSRTRLLQKDAPLTTDEIRCLRAINGGLNWLATQSRPDLSTQVSFSQQAFPEPLVSDAVAANNAVRRARQNAQLPIVFRAVPPGQLAVMCHSDAAYANGRDGATQAGFLVSYTHKEMNDGEVQQWTPAYWRNVVSNRYA